MVCVTSLPIRHRREMSFLAKASVTSFVKQFVIDYHDKKINFNSMNYWHSFFSEMTKRNRYIIALVQTNGRSAGQEEATNTSILFPSEQRKVDSTGSQQQRLVITKLKLLDAHFTHVQIQWHSRHVRVFRFEKLYEKLPRNTLVKKRLRLKIS